MFISVNVVLIIRHDKEEPFIQYDDFAYKVNINEDLSQSFYSAFTAIQISTCCHK